MQQLREYHMLWYTKHAQINFAEKKLKMTYLRNLRKRKLFVVNFAKQKFTNPIWA